MSRLGSVRLAVPCLVAIVLHSQPARSGDGADTFYGSYNEATPIEVPSYHGVEPKLSVTYNSSGGSSDVGIGWDLAGVPSIERTSAERGAPTYTATDRYLLGGQELVACGTGVVSPSCSNGGTHASKFESYAKIVFASSTNKWTVTQKDGSVTTFSAVYATASGTFRWGVSSVADKNANTTTYAWWCDGAYDCYPNTISYGANTVTFYRDLVTTPVYFANGVGVGQTRYRVKTIDIKTSGSRVRAYKLGYVLSAATSRSVLSSIQMYGKDAVVDASGNVTGGTALPAVAFTYYAEPAATFGAVVSSSTAGNYVGWGTPEFADVNGDGKDDAVLFIADSNGFRGKIKLATGGGNFGAVLSPATAGNFNGWPAPKLADVNGDGMTDVVTYITDGSGFRGYVMLATGSGNFGAAIYSATATNYNGWPTPQLADVNGDGKDDVVTFIADGTGFRGNVKLSTGNGSFGAAISSITAGNFNGWPTPRFADVNGDGLADAVSAITDSTGFRSYVKLATGGGAFGPAIYSTAAGNYNGWPTPQLADVNSDGMADMITYLADSAGFRGNVRLSLGSGSFGPAIASSTTANYTGWPVPQLADVNGDGLVDLVTYLADSAGFRGHVKLSLGTGSFGPAIASSTTANYSGWPLPRLADVNGDGKADVVTYIADGTGFRGNVKLSTGDPGVLLKTSKNTLGGITTITYAPSSTWVNTNNPPFVQTVLSVAENDGRGTVGTMTYSYSGGLYDRAERRFLGFRYAKETEPCITGESTCPYTETWFKQDYGSASKPETIYVKDGAGKLQSASTYAYTTNGATVPHTSVETGRWQYLYDGSGAACSAWPCAYGKRTYLARTYDTYGNVTNEIAYGDYDVAGDEVTTATTYYPNTAAYLVGFPGLVMVHKGTSTAGTKLFESRLHYDQTTAHTTAPTKGLLRRESKWLSSTGAFVNTDNTYDSYGNILTSTNAVGGITSSTYDATHHMYPVTRTDPMGRVVSSTYDYVCGKPLSATLSDGRVTTFQYDNLCRETRSDAPGGGYTVHAYGSLGTPASQYVQITTPGPGAGTTWTREYFDGLGRSWRKEAKGVATGQEIREDAIFDVRGNLWKKSAPYYANATAKWLVASYDARDRVTRVTNPDATYQTTAYALWSTTVTDELGRWTTEYVNGKGQITERREKLATSYVKTTYGYDDRGNPKTITDDSGNVWSFTYDSLGRRTQTIDPDVGTTNYVFDAAGRELSRTDSRGKVTTHAYDALNRVTQRVSGSGQAGSITVSFAYDQARTGYYNMGKLTTVTDPLGSQTLDYSIAGHLVRSTRIISGTSYTFSKGFDSGGRLLWTTYPDGDTVGTAASPLTYDASGNLLTVPGYLSAAVYDAAGRVTSFTLANGVVSTRTYDANRGWLKTISTVKGTTSLQSLTYTRNNAGLITTLASNRANEGWTYAYDDLGRLTAATNTSSSTNNQTYAYSKTGNITSNSRVGSYSYPATGAARPHAVSAAGSNAYAYDAAGNMTSGAGRSFTWDAAGRLSQVNSDSYGYDASGERITKTEGGATTHYVGGDYEVKAGVVTKYIAIGTSRIAKKVGATKYYLHTDHLGSVQAVTDAAGVEVQRHVYRPFGERLSTSTSHAQTRGYTGQVEDSSGLTFLNARYYDAALGRFVSADPSMPADSSAGLNRYSYADNDPVNHTDIDGLGFFSKIKSVFKKVGKVFKRIGQTLQKWASAVAKIPVIGGVLGLVLNTVGALFQGDWANALRGVAVIAIIVATIYISGVVNAAIGLNGGLLQLGGRLAAQAAIGGASGFLTARVQGATHAEALKAGIMGAKLGFAMEAFSSFIDAIPGSEKWKMGTKTDQPGSRPESLLGKWADSARAKFNSLFSEEGWFSSKFLGQSSMRGTQKLMSFLHDNFMVGATKWLGDGTWYPDGAQGHWFKASAGTSFELFLVEYPINFGSIWAFEKAFSLAGERIEARLSAEGRSTLGFLANATLNPFMGFQSAIEYGARARLMREYLQQLGM